MSIADKPLPRAFYEQNTAKTAQKLLGKRLVRTFDDGTQLTGIISEVEAYLGENDLASHAVHGKTKRTTILFGKAGYAYVHQIHRQYCIDVTTGLESVPESILIRGIVPETGLDQMITHRGRRVPINQIANGPGKLTQALKIDLSFYGVDMTDESSPLYITEGPKLSFITEIAPRIGISKSRELPLRFLAKDLKFRESAILSHRKKRDWSV